MTNRVVESTSLNIRILRLFGIYVYWPKWTLL